MGYPGGHYLHRYPEDGDPRRRRGQPTKRQALVVGVLILAFIGILVVAAVTHSGTKNPKIVGRRQVAQTTGSGAPFFLYYLYLGNGQGVNVNQATYQLATPGSYYDAQDPADPVISQSEEENIDNGDATDQDPSVDDNTGGDDGGSFGGDDGSDAGGGDD